MLNRFRHFPAVFALTPLVARGALRGVRLKTRALKLFGHAASRALSHENTRASFESEVLAVSFAVSGFSLFEKAGPQSANTAPNQHS